MNTQRERIYIAVKTYPTISEKYSELVCTAGVREDGSWIRLYPMPFRLLKNNQKYPKYTWIQADVERNFADFRPESFRPVLSSIKVEPKPQKPNWEERRNILFKNKEIYTNRSKLVQHAKDKSHPFSLALFKPRKIKDFIIEPDSREWNAKKLASLYAQSQQLNLFQTIEEIENEFRVVRKVPYKFSYRFEDDEGKESTLMVEDWEIGMLYFNCLHAANGNEQKALANVRKKYFEQFISQDIHFILGTTLKNHFVSKNPFIIIGVFYPPAPSRYQQMSLFE